MKRNLIRVLVVIVGVGFLASGIIGLFTKDKNEGNHTTNEVQIEVDNTSEEVMDIKTEDEAIDESEVIEAPITMSNEGELAPDFEFVDADGNVYNNETFLGEKVYLKYWASWCSICLAGLDEIDTLFTEAEGFTIYTVVTPYHRGELGQAEFEEWFSGIEQKNIKVLYDMKGQAAVEFGVRAFPTQVFIGSDGVLISTSPGHKSNEDIIDIMDTFY